jgi:hypothetical protein
MARRKVGPFGAVDRYIEEMSKPERVTNYANGIRGYIADKEALNLTKYKLWLYQQSLKKKSAEISAVVKGAVSDYLTSLGPIPRHRKQQIAVKKIAEQKPAVEASVKRVTDALAALATVPAV